MTLVVGCSALAADEAGKLRRNNRIFSIQAERTSGWKPAQVLFLVRRKFYIRHTHQLVNSRTEGQL